MELTEQTEKDKEVEKRRVKINFMLTKGLTELDIAQQTGWSIATIERDVAWLREESKNWIDTLAKGGFIFEWQKHQEKLKDTERQLNIMLEETDLDEQKKDAEGKPKRKYKIRGEERAKILKQRDDNIAMQNQMMLDGPTVHIMKTRLGGLEEDGQTASKFSQESQ